VQDRREALRLGAGDDDLAAHRAEDAAAHDVEVAAAGGPDAGAIKPPPSGEPWIWATSDGGTLSPTAAEAAGCEARTSNNASPNDATATIPNPRRAAAARPRADPIRDGSAAAAAGSRRGRDIHAPS
jgi:hypothetical protein